MQPGESLPIDVAVSVEPQASSKCLISPAVAVVEVKICRGVYGDNTVVIEGSQRGSMGLLLSTDLHTVTHEQNQRL